MLNSMLPERILYGIFKNDHAYAVFYDVELALAGIPAYYVHRARHKGDGLKKQRTVSELPIPEPAIFVYDRDETGFHYADVVITSTFTEALAFLPGIRSAQTHKGSVAGDLGKYTAERERIERDAELARENETAELANEHPGQMILIF